NVPIKEPLCQSKNSQTEKPLEMLDYSLKCSTSTLMANHHVSPFLVLRVRPGQLIRRVRIEDQGQSFPEQMISLSAQLLRKPDFGFGGHAFRALDGAVREDGILDDLEILCHAGDLGWRVPTPTLDMRGGGDDTTVGMRAEPGDIAHEDAEDDENLEACTDDGDILGSAGTVELREEMQQAVSILAAYVRFDCLMELVVELPYAWIVDKELGWA
ncbi:MAG: hypothetical protein Q9196_007260, partial [Gyalolechia fulgens]